MYSLICETVNICVPHACKQAYAHECILYTYTCRRKKDDYNKLLQENLHDCSFFFKIYPSFQFSTQKKDIRASPQHISGSSAPLWTFVLWNHQYVELGFLLDKHLHAMAVVLITKGDTQWLTGEWHMLKEDEVRERRFEPWTGDSSLGQDGAGWYKTASRDSERHAPRNL